MIFFGGISEEGSTDRVAEFKNLEWNLLGNLAGPRNLAVGFDFSPNGLILPRMDHRSIKMGNKIYLFGGFAK